ncbi:hypothetical protein LCGC14_1565900 [marine sediment metagenome]|uniref:Uncharacterized protein n=1 Tax=marine sediment metagenome TaxID=412755 RepID=A0A0F9LLP2_9ZZZZ
MKKTIPKLNKSDVKKVTAWLTLPSLNKENFCPWRLNKRIPEKCVDICEALFPKLKNIREEQLLEGRPSYDAGNCPCNSYSLSYVIKTVKNLLKVKGDLS